MDKINEDMISREIGNWAMASGKILKDEDFNRAVSLYTQDLNAEKIPPQAVSEVFRRARMRSDRMSLSVVMSAWAGYRDEYYSVQKAEKKRQVEAGEKPLSVERASHPKLRYDQEQWLWCCIYHRLGTLCAHMAAMERIDYPHYAKLCELIDKNPIPDQIQKWEHELVLYKARGKDAFGPHTAILIAWHQATGIDLNNGVPHGQNQKIQDDRHDTGELAA